MQHYESPRVAGRHFGPRGNIAPDRLEPMKKRAADKGFNFPYLYDSSQKSARDYGATCTPHVFLLDKERRVAEALGPWFRREEARTVAFPLRLPRRHAALLAGMGPSAHHLDPAAIAAAVAALPEPVEVTAAVRVEVHAPAGP